MDAPKLLLHAPYAPGDTCIITMLVESIAAQFPGRFQIDVIGTCAQEIFARNPHITPFDHGAAFEKYLEINKGELENGPRKEGQDRKALILDDICIVPCEHPKIHTSNQVNISFLGAICDFVGGTLELPLAPQVNRPAFYLSGIERRDRLLPGPYVLLNAGWKDDAETKWYARWQEVVNGIRQRWPELTIVQVGESWHHHPPLDGVLNLVGQWNRDARKLIVAANNAAFCLGPISFLTHVCAGLGIPYVCVLTGYEPLSWAWYPGIKYISRHGSLPCCRYGGCWKRTWKECTNLRAPNKPACLDIEPVEIVSAIAEIIEGGVGSLSVETRPAITVGTLYFGELAEQGASSAAVLKDYAKKHDYDFAAVTKSLAPERHPCWSKVPMIRDWMRANQEGWFFWVDADAVIMDLEKSLESLLDADADLIIGDDAAPNRVNAGVFLMRACTASLAFLDAVWAEDIRELFYEQTAMTRVMERMPEYRVKIVPRRTFNSFAHEYVAGDFIIHFAGHPRVRKKKEKAGKCKHLGKPTGEKHFCKSCKGHVEIFEHACAVHGRCVLGQATESGVRGCWGCPDGPNGNNYVEPTSVEAVAPPGPTNQIIVSTWRQQ